MDIAVGLLAGVGILVAFFVLVVALPIYLVKKIKWR